MSMILRYYWVITKRVTYVSYEYLIIEKLRQHFTRDIFISSSSRVVSVAHARHGIVQIYEFYFHW